jgi:hypothetical protein
VLIDVDGIPVRVHSDEARRPRRALVRLLLQLHPLSFQLALQLTDVLELGQRLFPFYRLLSLIHLRGHVNGHCLEDISAAQIRMPGAAQQTPLRAPADELK